MVQPSRFHTALIADCAPARSRLRGLCPQSHARFPGLDCYGASCTNGLPFSTIKTAITLADVLPTAPSA